MRSFWRSGLRALFGCAVLLGVAGASVARAYCRSSTETEPSGDCEESPDALFLTWKRNCLTYSFHEDMFARLDQLSESEVRSIVQASFETWMDVDCPDASDPFRIFQADGVTSESPVEFLFDTPNTAVISAQTIDEWRELGQPPSAFAITFLWHNKKTGEIFDVDMALNLRHAPFLDCGDQNCRGDGVDLQNTVTHEAGHVFGLGHSRVPGATMQFDARAGEIFMRDLEDDDREGLCALMLPGMPCPDGECMCPPPPAIPKVVRTSSGCSTTPGGDFGAGAPDLVPSALALALLGYRRRRLRTDD